MVPLLLFHFLFQISPHVHTPFILPPDLQDTQILLLDIAGYSDIMNESSMVMVCELSLERSHSFPLSQVCQGIEYLDISPRCVLCRILNLKSPRLPLNHSLHTVGPAVEFGYQ
jgi:hypothetical protein